MTPRVTGWQRAFLKGVQWADAVLQWSWRKLRPFALWLLGVLRRLGRVLWQETRSMAGWYASHRDDFRRYAMEFAPDLLSQEDRRREIRIMPGLRDVTAEQTDSGWHVVLPDCCVHCGHGADGDWRDERRQVENYGVPFWTIVVIITVSHLAALVLWRWSLILPGLALSLVAGWRVRRRVPVRIRYRLCAEHADRNRYPALRVFGSELIIRVGAKAVRQRFLNPGRAGEGWTNPAPMEPAEPQFDGSPDWQVSTAATSVPGTSPSTDSEEEPRTIPLVGFSDGSPVEQKSGSIDEPDPSADPGTEAATTDGGDSHETAETEDDLPPADDSLPLADHIDLYAGDSPAGPAESDGVPRLDAAAGDTEEEPPDPLEPPAPHRTDTPESHI